MFSRRLSGLGFGFKQSLAGATWQELPGSYFQYGASGLSQYNQPQTVCASGIFLIVLSGHEHLYCTVVGITNIRTCSMSIIDRR